MLRKFCTCGLQTFFTDDHRHGGLEGQTVHRFINFPELITKSPHFLTWISFQISITFTNCLVKLIIRSCLLVTSCEVSETIAESKSDEIIPSSYACPDEHSILAVPPADISQLAGTSLSLPIFNRQTSSPPRDYAAHI